MSVYGMKQGRRIRKGVSRQEVEKAWRRNEAGPGNPVLVDLADLKR
jgi:hypothetical protein